MKNRCILVVPTLNGASNLLWDAWLNAVNCQKQFVDQVLIIDSSSQDGTPDAARASGFTVEIIDVNTFNHGGTRQLAVNRNSDYEIVVFLTQDAVLSGFFDIRNLIECFQDESIGAAYGRQLPHAGSGPIGAHARVFNYKNKECVKSLADLDKLGLKAAFISNSFSAYRRTALMDVGGFPSDTIMNEDTWVAGKMLLAGWKVAYCADACVYHSHDYTVLEEFKRYFDIGVFHSREPWLMQSFGRAEGEGARYVRSEIKYLWENAPGLIPSALVRTVVKYAGYRLGRLERHLGVGVKRRLSMHRRYWKSVA